MISYKMQQLHWFQTLLLTGLLFLLLPAQADTQQNAAAQVLFSHGNVVLTNAGSSYPLEKGGALNAGDTVITGDDGRVQMRFSDGGLVSLMPNSRFAVEEYTQPTATDEGSASVNLLKGGLRALSGSIGKKDHDNYKLKTDVATLGIRGTQFVVVMDGAAMRVHVGEGRVALLNDFGDLLVPAGQHAEVFPGQAPILSTIAPDFASSPQPHKQSDEEQAEANQDPASASTESEAVRSLEAGVTQGAEPGEFITEDEDGNLITQKIPKNSDTPKEPAVDESATDEPITDEPVIEGGVNQPDVEPPVETPPVVDPPIDNPTTHTYDGGFASASIGQSITGIPDSSNDTYQQIGPTVDIKSVEQGGADLVQNPADYLDADIAANQKQTSGGLYWSEVAVETVSNPAAPSDYKQYKAQVWGASLASLPTSGTLSYALSHDSNQRAQATPVRTIYNQTNTNTLNQFDLTIELGVKTKFKANVATDNWQFEQVNPVGGNLDKNSGEFRFSVNNPSGNCPDCYFQTNGFLSGEQAAQAGVVYKYSDVDYIQHTGGAVLDKVTPIP